MKTDGQAIDKFIESWGTMGSIWGINTSTSRVHALLMTSSTPLSLDDIATRLKISRGNASMCLKELRSWAVIDLIKEPGDRRDYYSSKSDVRKMFLAIARERKRREFDPLVEMVQTTLQELREETGGHEAVVQERLEQMEELLTMIKTIGDRLLTDEKTALASLPLLLRLVKEAKKS